MKNIEELLDFYLTANNETRKNVTALIKEAINTSVKIADNKLVIGILGKAALIPYSTSADISNFQRNVRFFSANLIFIREQSAANKISEIFQIFSWK